MRLYVGLVEPLFLFMLMCGEQQRFQLCFYLCWCIKKAAKIPTGEEEDKTWYMFCITILILVA